ncbi:hypothetical protein T492DRAFT_1076075 [Pavlovales sp. CCMP2436]|nr:hypothetical protein T492DRAFT_1076075 [Pavlovales sp. CCMP2436]
MYPSYIRARGLRPRMTPPSHARLALRRAHCPEAAAPGMLRQARFAELCGRCYAEERCPKPPTSAPPSAARRSAPICDERRAPICAEYRAPSADLRRAPICAERRASSTDLRRAPSADLRRSAPGANLRRAPCAAR